MRLKRELVDIDGDWEEHHGLGGTHRLYIQPIHTEAEVGLIGNRQGDERGFDEGSQLLREVVDHLEKGGFTVARCPALPPAGQTASRQLFLAIHCPGLEGAEVGQRAAGVLRRQTGA